MKHTEGPWKIHRGNQDNKTYVIAGDNPDTADCIVFPTLSVNHEANARLIAESPTMYNHLKWLYARHNEWNLPLAFVSVIKETISRIESED